MKSLLKAKGVPVLTVVFLLASVLAGGQVLAATSTGTVFGVITNSLTGNPLSGVAVTSDPAVEGASVKTDADGKYSVTLPIGLLYTLTFEKNNFDGSTQIVVAIGDQVVTKDLALKPAAPVVVNTGEDLSGEPGGTVTLKASALILDGSTVTGYKWTQSAGVAAKIQNAGSQTATVTLANPAAYKEELFHHLESLDRFMVQGIDPHSLETAGEAIFKVAVTTSSGSYSNTVHVISHLPYAVSLGIQNVPVNVPVLLHGKAQDDYAWVLASPMGSSAALDDFTDQNPSFTPDVVGKYTLTEVSSSTSVDVIAGTWTGVITGKDEKGEPVGDKACTTCHNGTMAPDKFADWKRSGHAEIITQNIDDPSGHWSLGCASCHSVGYDTAADNNGFDEMIAEEGWEAPHGAVGNWDKMLADYPATARLANIQCENCHGPQDSAAHMQEAMRINISSDVCGACHGEPPRHGRFQQWEESKHANYDLAIERADNASCGRCHVGQGFLAWLPQLEAGNPGNIEAEITWTAEDVHPVTCAVCHDSHDPGKSSGEPNTATTRIDGDTSMLPAGFKAIGVGRGAICMTCHNSRNSERNDAAMAVQDDRVPHTASQADVLMGENAYFVEVGNRSPHSLIEDTCTTCHMVLSPPPAAFSRQGAGTNHSFEASMDICTSCHGAYDGGTINEAVHGGLQELQSAIEGAILAEIAAQTDAGNMLVLVKMGPDESDVEITAASAVTEVHFTETHGRQAMDLTVDGITYEHIRMGRDTLVKNAGGNELGTFLEASESAQSIAKAGWNFFLIEGDGSEGVHNASFTFQVINASLDALK